MESKKLKFKILIIIIIISIIFGYKITKNKVTAQDDTVSEVDEELLERAIIIDGLKLEIDNDSDNDQIEKKHGRHEKKILTKKSKVIRKKRISNKRSKKNQKNFLSELQKKEKEWHYTKYKIKKGDNLWQIAEKFDIPHIYIIKANKISRPDMLRPGKTINVPNKSGINYKIKKGDTLTSIAKKFNVTIKLIIKHNQINSDKIKIGESLFIPDAQKRKSITRRNNKNKKKKIIVKNIKLKENNKRKLVKAKLKFIWPMKGKVTSAFGIRKDPFTGRKKFHCGIDIGAYEGTRINAAAQGIVIFSGWKNGYGKVIVIKHKKGYITVYAHLSKLLKKVNQVVDPDDIIALSGKTGAVTGAHLHFEIRKYLTPLNPIRIIKESL